MNPARNPPKIKETPSTKPELLQEWRSLYEQLIKSYPKSRALQIIGHRYGGLSYQTVMYHLFPDYRENQKKQPSKKWSYEKQDPIIRRRVTDYKAKYMAARYHIGDLIKDSYRRALPQEALTLENLREAIFEISEIAFQPSTLEGLIKRFEATKGYTLLVEVPGDQESHSHYKLSNETPK